MTAAIAIDDFSRFRPATQDTGLSEASQTLKGKLSVLRAHFLQPISWGREFELRLTELQDILKDCSEDNWDGYHARPISSAAAEEASEFLVLLLSQMQIPTEIVPEPDGSIALEWYNQHGKNLSVSFIGSNWLAYSGRFNDGTSIYGVERFGTSIPTSIKAAIQRLYA